MLRRSIPGIPVAALMSNGKPLKKLYLFKYNEAASNVEKIILIMNAPKIAIVLLIVLFAPWTTPPISGVARFQESSQ